MKIGEIRNKVRGKFSGKPAKEGAEKAEYIARKTLSKAQKKVGLLPAIR